MWGRKKKIKVTDIDDTGRTQATQDYSARVNPRLPGGIVGLPEDIRLVIEASKFSPGELTSSRQDIEAAARFHLSADYTQYIPSPELLSRLSLEQQLEQAATFKKENPLTCYQTKFGNKSDYLGKGGYGKVYKCTRRTDGENFAMKIAKLENKASLEREIRMHALCKQHKNVVEFIEAFEFKHRLFIIVELMDYGDLTSFVTQLPAGVRWKEPAIAFVLKQVLTGLAFMHSNHHLHRDIKSDNILVNSEGEVKIADFGFAVGLVKEKDERSTKLGTPCWMAPEIIDEQGYGPKVDVWALGITLIEIAQRLPPHMKEDRIRALFLIKNQPAPRFAQPELWSEDLNNFLASALKKDPAERSDSRTLLMHPFLRSERICAREDFAFMLRDIRELQNNYSEA